MNSPSEVMRRNLPYVVLLAVVGVLLAAQPLRQTKASVPKVSQEIRP